jgi:hypothetical protein
MVQFSPYQVKSRKAQGVKSHFTLSRLATYGF